MKLPRIENRHLLYNTQQIDLMKPIPSGRGAPVSQAGGRRCGINRKNIKMGETKAANKKQS